MAEMVISLKQWVRNTTGLNMIFASELEQKSNDEKKDEKKDEKSTS